MTRTILSAALGVILGVSALQAATQDRFFRAGLGYRQFEAHYHGGPILNVAYGGQQWSDMLGWELAADLGHFQAKSSIDAAFTQIGIRAGTKAYYPGFYSRLSAYVGVGAGVHLLVWPSVLQGQVGVHAAIGVQYLLSSGVKGYIEALFSGPQALQSGRQSQTTDLHAGITIDILPPIKMKDRRQKVFRDPRLKKRIIKRNGTQKEYHY